MTIDIQKLERYVFETLEVSLKPVPWQGIGDLPLFLQHQYSYMEIQLLGNSFLLMVDEEMEEKSPANLRKHTDILRSHWSGEIIYVRDRIASYNRKRLIQYKIPFIIPGNQMYLPTLALDLREHFRTLRHETKSFTPSTQALLVYILLNGRGLTGINPSQMAKKLNYSSMTMTRAFDELESAELVIRTSKGKECFFQLNGSSKEVWSKSMAFLQTPVKKRLHLASPSLSILPGPRAGLSALCDYSMLSQPPVPVIAISKHEYNVHKGSNNIVVVPEYETAAIDVEIWSYVPNLLAVGEVVDPLSLWLSLKEQSETDERIEDALEQLLKGVKW